MMVRENRKQCEQNKSTLKGFSIFCVLCVFRGQTMFNICVYLRSSVDYSDVGLHK